MEIEGTSHTQAQHGKDGSLIDNPQAGDHIVRGTAAHGMVRGFAAYTRATVQEAHECHGTSPVVTAALGRLLTAGAMMGAMLKDEGELLTLTIRCDGPVGGLIVTADAQGHVKGYAANPDVWLPLSEAGKLDVGKAVGQGTLTVVQDQPWGEPYTSQLDLFSGEIGDDIAAYFAESEQVPTSVGVGVLVDTDLSVKQAGGFIVQLMPDCPDEVISQLEENLSGLGSVTTMLERGHDPHRHSADRAARHGLPAHGEPPGGVPLQLQPRAHRPRTHRHGRRGAAEPHRRGQARRTYLQLLQQEVHVHHGGDARATRTGAGEVGVGVPGGTFV